MMMPRAASTFSIKKIATVILGGEEKKKGEENIRGKK